MADVKIHFHHPTDGRTLTVDLDDTITSQDAIAELIANDFIPANPQGYNLAIKGGAQLQRSQSFRDAGVADNTNIRIIPATDAGCFTKTSS